MKNIVLIGASGFVGTNLIGLLGTESCINIDKAPSTTYNDITLIHDIRNDGLEKLLPKGTETIVLLAAEHRDDVRPLSLYYEVNVEGTRKVLKAMDNCGIRNIIFTSSAAVYGLDKQNPDEEYAKDPFHPYGKSKLMAEEILTEWYKQAPEQKTLTIVRSAVIFGENNRGNVHNLLMQIANRRFLMVGKGNNKKSMAYVGNAAAFLKFLTENQPAGVEVYNYVDYPDLSMNELVAQVETSLGEKLPPIRFPYWMGMLGGFCFDIISRITGKNFAITSDRVKKFCATTQFNAAKAHATGFQPPFTLAQGLDRTLQSEFGKRIIKQPKA